MKSTALYILAAVVVSLVGVRGDAVSCSVIDYLYYSSDCCDNSNSVQCMESIPQTDKAAIDNLASLKRPDGSVCQSGDSIKFTADTGSGSSGIVCADADSCIIPCENGGTISGTVSGNDCTCTCPTGFEGPPACTTATPCPACFNGGSATGSVAGGDCGCDCSATGGYTGDNCEISPPPAYVFYDTNPINYTDIATEDIATETECKDLFDNHRYDIASDLGANLTAFVEYWGSDAGGNRPHLAAQYSTYDGKSTIPLGCSIKIQTGSQMIEISHNTGGANGDDHDDTLSSGQETLLLKP